MAQRPAAIGMLLCEQVIIEESTKNVTPVNCFRRRTVRRFPSDPFEFVVLAMLNDGVGEISLDLVIERLDTLDAILKRSISFRLRDQLQEVCCLFRIRGCSFPVPSGYEALRYANKELIAQRRFRIIQEETV